VVSQSFTLNVTGATNFASWISTFAPLTNVSAQGDPDADSVPNLVEYALNRNPKIGETAAAIAFQSTASSLQLTYRVHKAHSDVTLIPEWSATLPGASIWSNAGITVTVLEDNAENQLIRATLPINSQNTQRFLRLRASQVGTP
jgi:hypothetical protein